MWTPDSQVGIVILSPPPIPKIDHPVEWIQSRYQIEQAQERGRTQSGSIEPGTEPHEDLEVEDNSRFPAAVVSRPASHIKPAGT